MATDPNFHAHRDRSGGYTSHSHPGAPGHSHAQVGLGPSGASVGSVRGQAAAPSASTYHAHPSGRGGGYTHHQHANAAQGHSHLQLGLGPSGASVGDVERRQAERLPAVPAAAPSAAAPTDPFGGREWTWNPAAGGDRNANLMVLADGSVINVNDPAQRAAFAERNRQAIERTNAEMDVTAPDSSAAAGRSFEANARLLYPWLANMPELLAVFVDKWEETGDAALAWGAVRASPAYDRYFAGNRRSDGSFRHSEQEYMAVRDGYRQLFREYNLDPSLFESHFSRGIEGDVSIPEAAERLASRWEYVQRAAPEARAWYAEHHGWAPSDSDLLASAVDPNVTETLFRKRAEQSLIGGTAAQFGFRRGAASVDRLMQAGLTAGQARQLYGQAAEQVPSLSAFAARYYDPDDAFDIDDFEAATVLLDPEQQRRARGLLAAERSAFSQVGQFAQGRTGGLSGLTQR